jgi:AraC-like DNA-binding protein
MTARADRLIKRAKTADRVGSVRSSYPVSSACVFVDALERLKYCMEPLLANAGIRRADLHDSDARIPCAVWGRMFSRALEQRPMKNAGMRLATVTPEDRFRAGYASFCHQPDDVAEIERVLDCPVYTRAAWNGWALSRETYQLPLRRCDPVLGGLLQRQADEAIARLPSMEVVALEVRQALAARVGGGDTRIQTIARTLATSPRSLQRRLAAAGVSYQQLLDLARRDAADRYLTDSALSIGEAAYLLGYSEPAAFNRAFKRWRHETPRPSAERRHGFGRRQGVEEDPPNVRVTHLSVAARSKDAERSRRSQLPAKIGKAPKSLRGDS